MKAIERMYNDWKQKFLMGEFNRELEKLLKFMEREGISRIAVFKEMLYEIGVNKQGKYFYSWRQHRSWYAGKNNLFSIIIDLEKRCIYAVPWDIYGWGYEVKGSVWGILERYSVYGVEEYKVFVVNKIEQLKCLDK